MLHSPDDFHAKTQSRKGQEPKLPENIIARAIVDASYQVHQELGPGLLESVYEVILAAELRDRGFEVERQVPIEIKYGNLIFDEGYRADLLINGLVIVELKSVEELHRSRKKQVLTYLRLSDLRLGILINFGDNYIKDNIFRIANGLPEESD